MSPLRTGVRRSTARAVVLAALAIIVAAVGWWALFEYDGGPGFAAASVAEVQVADGGWVTVDLGGPAGAETAAFLAAVDDARALWPPRLLFE